MSEPRRPTLDETRRGGASTFAPNHDAVLCDLAGAKNYNRWLLDRARPYIGERMLDVGAGIGTFVELALEDAAEVAALEPDPAFADYLRRRFEGRPVEVLEQDVTGLDPAQTAPFDSAICFNVLEHVHDEGEGLRRLLALLRPGGRLLLLVPAHEWLVSPYDRAVGHERRYERADLRAALVGAGFELTELCYVNPVGAIGWLVSMRLGRRNGMPSGQLRAFDRLVPLLRPLDALRLPFGQSLWAVARRPQSEGV